MATGNSAAGVPTGCKRILLLAVVLFAGIAVTGPVSSAFAATFTANSTADELDRKPGDGGCLTAAGDCTLRAAVQETNALGGGPHTIALLAGARYTLVRFGEGENAAVRGDLDIASNVSLVVPGGQAVVQGDVLWDDRIFEVHAGWTASLEGIEIMGGSSGRGGGISNDGTLTLTNSSVYDNTASVGGGISNNGTLTVMNGAVSSNIAGTGGAISNDGTLTVTNSTVSGNRAGNGGGISNDGTLTLTNSTVSGNISLVGGSGGGIFNAGALMATNSTINANRSLDDYRSGGGVFNNGMLTVASSTVSGNNAADGGGISNDGTLILTNSTVSGNAGHRRGGGIFTSGTLSVTNSTVSGNRVAPCTGAPCAGLPGAGGGGGIFASGAMSLTNGTVSGNSASGDGGGIYLHQSSSLSLTNSTISTNNAARNGGGIWNLGTASVNNVTVANNVADADGDGGDGGGVFNVSGGVVSVANTIIGDNLDASTAATTKFPDCLGSLSSRGFNLVENTTGCTIEGATSSNITGRNPLLGPLQDNGGPTQTHALEVRTVNIFGLVGQVPSPAIDAGSLGGASACANADQRGVTRRDGNADGVARCDIGAYEYVPPVFKLGTLALTPTEATVRPLERITYSVSWTVPPPRGWRSLRTLELALLDDGGVVLWVRFEEVAGAPGLFRVVSPKNGHAGPAFAPASPSRLESEFATVYLANSAVDGPPGPMVALTLTLSFKPNAAGRTYDLLVAASDDAGEVQGFHRAGAVAVSA